MARKCVGGGHDTASVYTDAQARECVSNDGTVVDDGSTCSSGSAANFRRPQGADADSGMQAQNLVLGTQATIDELILFPLRMVRVSFGETSFVREFDRINGEAAAEINRLAATDDGLRDRIFGVLVEVSAMAAAILEGHYGKGVVGRYTVSSDFIERSVAVAEEVKTRTSDDRLKEKLSGVISLSRILVGHTIEEVTDLLQHNATT